VRIVTAAVNAGLPATSAPYLVEAILTANATELTKVPGISPTIIGAAIAAAHQGFFKSFQVVYYASLAFGALAILAAVAVNGELLQSKLTKEVPRKLRKIAVETPTVEETKVESALEEGPEAIEVN
jgi:hypothetical protein